MEYPRTKDELLILLEVEKIKGQRVKDELELERLRRPQQARKSIAPQSESKPAADKAEKPAAAEKTPKPAKEASKDASSGTPASTGAKRSRKLDTCSACDAVGHRRTSSKCPMFGKTAAGENAEGAD